MSTTSDYCQCADRLYAIEGEATYTIGPDGLPQGTGMWVRRYCSRCNKDIDPRSLPVEDDDE